MKREDEFYLEFVILNATSATKEMEKKMMIVARSDEEDDNAEVMMFEMSGL